MKKIILSLSLLLTGSCLSIAQQYLKMNFFVANEIEKYNRGETKSDRIISLLVKGDVAQIQSLTESLGGKNISSIADIAVLHLPLSKISTLAGSPFVQRIEENCSHVKPLNDRAAVNSRANIVQMGFPPLPQGYDGTGIVIGVIDGGIDYFHPDFRDEFGKTRIKYWWSHNLPDSANSPQQYGYGQEWDSTQIDSLINSDNKVKSSSFYLGHGNHVSGIAAGNGLALNNYKGSAPNADIISVELNFDSQNWLSSVGDAVEYIFDKAAAMGKPCVINASVGDYYGSHDGRDQQAIRINDLIANRNGQVLVAAAGNAGHIPYHLGYTVTSDSLFTWVNSTGQIFLQMWGDTGSFENVQFAIGADQVTPSYMPMSQTPFKTLTPFLGVFKYDSLYAGSSRFAQLTYTAGYAEGRYAMTIIINPDSTAYNWRLITKGSGKFDLWAFELISGNLPDTTQFPAIKRYVMPDKNQTIVSSFQCAPNTITVANYNNRISYSSVIGVEHDTTGMVLGDLSIASSKGPTRDGRIKPEIAAPGDWTLSCGVLTDMPFYISNYPHGVGAGGLHILDGGTSSASPVVAGCAALYLQRYPNASVSDVRTALFACPITDNYTGTTPNNAWGYGKVDAYTLVAGCPTGTDETGAQSLLLANYPNPFSGHTTIYCDLSRSGNYSKANMVVYDIIGKTVATIPVNEKNGAISFSSAKLEAGVYFYSIIVDGKTIKTRRMLVE